MSDRNSLPKIVTVLLPTLLFLLAGAVTDRDVFRYPLLLSGKGMEREKGAIVATLRMYDKIFNDFHSSGGGITMLNRFPAVTALRHDVFRDIGYIRNAGRVLVYEMADLVPVEVKMTSPATAEAVVLEQWNYQYQLKDGRKPVTETKGMGRGLRYYLVREKGHWVVSAWNPAQVEEPPITEFRY